MLNTRQLNQLSNFNIFNYYKAFFWNTTYENDPTPIIVVITTSNFRRKELGLKIYFLSEVKHLHLKNKCLLNMDTKNGIVVYVIRKPF